jgi:hypothetical protein
MRHFFVSIAVLAASVFAVETTPGFDTIHVPYQGQSVKLGDTLHIVWDPNSVSGTVMLQLMEGDSPTTLQLDPVPLAIKVDNLGGYYGWAIPSSIGSFPAYGIQITLDGTQNQTIQRSFPFTIKQ